MKRKHHFTAKCLLALATLLPLTACTDNDLETTSDSNGTHTEQTDDAEWKKQLTMQCLLEAVANVDTLPNNWRDEKFYPAIGQAASADNPYGIRQVVTTSVSEAYREFCSLTASPNSANTPTSQETIDLGQDIGTLTFCPGDSTSGTFATVNVNVQQLPTLQQIRFVSASTLGNNSGKADITPYYQFGDVVKQEADGQTTYWVCVRPYNGALDLGKTHWCSFQLNPATSNNANFKQVENTLTLPTNLSKGNKQADTERMVQNFFNVLRCLADPELYDDITVKGIDKITKSIFSWNDMRNTSYLWGQLGIWKQVMPSYYQAQSSSNDKINDLKSLLKSNDETINALYLGYTSKWTKMGLGKTTYKLYNLKLSWDRHAFSNNYSLFNKATPETPTVEWEKTGAAKDFAKLLTEGPSQGEALLGNDYSNLFIVRHKTGAQLQGKLFSSANDDSPEASFQTSAPGKGLTDVCVRQNILKTGEKGYKAEKNSETFEPFFTYGDVVTNLYNKKKYEMGEDECHVCLLPANNAEGTAQEDMNDYAYFLSNNCQPACIGDKLTNDEALRIALLLMNAYYHGTKKYGNLLNITDKAIKMFDANISSAIYDKFKKNKAITFEDNSTDDGITKLDLSVNLYLDNAKTESCGYNKLAMNNASVLKLHYENDSQKKETTLTYSVGLEDVKYYENSHFLPVFKYKDTNKYCEQYSKEREFSIVNSTYRNVFKTDFYKILKKINFVKQQ